MLILNAKRKLSPRKITVCTLVTAIGILVLLLLVFLLGLLHWMTATVLLPDPERLVHPDSKGAFVFQLSRDENHDGAEYIAEAFLEGMPTSVCRLVRKGVADPQCAVQFVTSVFPAGDLWEITSVASLGRYPGLSRLVRRSLERQCRNGLWSASIQYHRQQPIFLDAENRHRLNAVSMIRTSIFRASNAAAIRALINNSYADYIPTRAKFHAPQTDTENPACMWGWGETWDALPLHGFIGSDRARRIQEFRNSLVHDIPPLIKAADFRFQGTFPDASRMRLNISFALPIGTFDETSLPQSLDMWLTTKGKAFGLKPLLIEYEDGRIEMDVSIYKTRE